MKAHLWLRLATAILFVNVGHGGAAVNELDGGRLDFPPESSAELAEERLLHSSSSSSSSPADGQWNEVEEAESNLGPAIRTDHQTLVRSTWPEHEQASSTNDDDNSVESDDTEEGEAPTKRDGAPTRGDSGYGRAASSGPGSISDVSMSDNQHGQSRPRKRYGLDPEHHRASRRWWCDIGGVMDEVEGYCHKLETAQDDGARVCASDGQFYKTLCEFKRQSCALPETEQQLFRVKPSTFCLARESRGCTRLEYRQFKAAILNEFNENAELLFKYLDANHDGQLDARELWPRSRDDEPTGERSICDDCHDDEDFAFEPHFSWNSCSLSHLLVYEVGRTSGVGLSWDEFWRAFASSSQQNKQSSNSPANHTKERESQSGVDSASIRRFKETKLIINLGESTSVDCLPEQELAELGMVPPQLSGLDCSWTRYGVNLGAARDEHITLERSDASGLMKRHRGGGQPLRLQLNDAQLYLSGPYECSCNLSPEQTGPQQQYKTIQRRVNVQVLARPYVSVRPKFQWSLPDSRIAFECRHDFIDTSFGHSSSASGYSSSSSSSSSLNSFEAPQRIDGAQSSDYKLKWLRDGQNWVVDSKEYERREKSSLAECSARASVVAASGRLVLERVQANDTGRYYCLAEQLASEEGDANRETDSNDSATKRIISTGKNYGRLLIQDKPESILEADSSADGATKFLWAFHENGISVYRLRSDDGQQLELVRELAGQSPISAEVDGNWNQLTLCGGLNQDQVVICEWSDNALLVEVPRGVTPNVGGATDDDDDDDDDGDDNDLKAASKARTSTTFAKFERENSARVLADKYVYVGQPNLNRVIVMDGQLHEIVAIINTEPQPRKLHSFRPNKIHLSKWVRRRLSPMANARWLKAIDEQQQNAKQQQQQQSRAHPLRLTPKSSRLYSDKRQPMADAEQERLGEEGARFRRHSPASAPMEHRSMTPPKLVQHDIWLLCYGQPIVVDPSSDLSELVVDLADERAIMQADGRPLSPSSSSSSSFRARKGFNGSDIGPNGAPTPFTPLVAAWPLIGPHWMPSITGRKLAAPSSASPSSSSPPSPPYSANKEARLRNRKSVQIIQSTFFPAFGNPTAHHHSKQPASDSRTPSSPSSASKAVGKFKRLTVLTTHYVIASRGMSSISDEERSYLSEKLGQEGGLRVPQYDLVQSLSVPKVPHSQRENPKFKLHHAYVTHYDERQLYRVSMDSYRYDKEINLSDCDPVNLISASQGLLIVQCRSPITHDLAGQLVLDELSSRKIQFNDNIKAQESCLTPDNRYLISILTNQSSTIYVQSVRVDGLSLLYEIKTTLETTQCSFVWRDGYYAAIFVALNRRDRQSELLSLRLADSRLELIVRVPGLMRSTMRHKEPLNVEQDLQIVSLSTDSGVHIIDLEENRVIQTMDHRHQRTTPTLLWV